MNQPTDIRDRVHLPGSEVKKLNFIKDSKTLVFRKYYRSGLRSHIFEVLLAEAVLKETQGEIIDGIRMFPRARPVKMFRILRNRFESKAAVFREIEKYNLLLKFLGKDLIALSEEFLVDYRGTGNSQIVLCGLQEYVPGPILDPWRFFGEASLMDILQNQALVGRAKKNIALFVNKVRQMIDRTGYIPDLAGIGNLILTSTGELKLVDINNIVEIKLDDTILLDDKGYPSCDVSIAVLSILEKKVLGKEISMDDRLYRHFLSTQRKDRVKAIEKEFYANL
ncbi:MAG: hypothetical protein KKC20_15930 [Proteobacteria bacterium]|nr:hypothetical protein [Pseudomonadota bacterium]